MARVGACEKAVEVAIGSQQGWRVRCQEGLRAIGEHLGCEEELAEELLRPGFHNRMLAGLMVIARALDVESKPALKKSKARRK